MSAQKTMTAIIKLAGKIDGSLLKSMSTAEKRMSAMKKAGAAVGAAVAAATTVAVKQIGESVDKAMEYQTQYAKVKTLLTDNTDYDAYSKAILKASTETGIATENLTETVYQAISASVDQADAIQFAGTAAKLAKGGFSDSATAVDVLTTALNAYGKESGLTAESVSDLLITTQNLGKTTVNDLAGSIGKVIPVAKTYGVSMDNLTTSYAILTKNGISTAESTTYLRSMMNELGKTSSGVSKMLVSKTGKNFAQLQADGKNLYDVIDMLSESVNGDSTAFANLWSNQRAGMGALALLNAGSEEYSKTLDAMAQSGGAAAKAAGTMGDTYASAKAKIDNAMANMQIAVGNKLAPILTQVAQVLLPKVQDSVLEAMDALDGIDITQLSNDVAGAVSTRFDVFKAAGPYIQKAADVVGSFFGRLAESKAVQEIVSALGKVVYAAFTLIGSVVSAVMPVALTVVETAWGGIKAAFGTASSIASTVSGVFNSIYNAITHPIETARNVIGAAIEAIKGFFSFQIAWPNIPMPHFSVAPPGWQIGDLLKGSIPSLGIEWYAKGGFTRGPIAIAGEAGPEAVISFDQRYRSDNIGYWVKAGQMLGVLRAYATGGFTASPAASAISSGTVLSNAAASAGGASSGTTVSLGGVTFAPNITVSGDAGSDIVTQIRQASHEFFDMLDEWAADREDDYAPVF